MRFGILSLALALAGLGAGRVGLADGRLRFAIPGAATFGVVPGP